ncbi:preprotein translocase subunit SecG [Spiroplasma endosymbiont of Aspidapion aeneum]|uniref:preprotein translocase subunit SecG n=1 Tax=Spiroplasma endosymbiont of Aspidapion aeneum TaxID=3066276 RepID=UPI00313EE578
MNMILLTSTSTNYMVLVFEIMTFIAAIIMIIIGLLQNKSTQTGLSALNGGNDDLFQNSKERGFDKTLSNWMFIFGIILFVLAVICSVLNNALG